MPTIRPSFLSSAERLELEVCVRSQREDHGVARRANAILLLDDGKSCQVIAEFLYLDYPRLAQDLPRERLGRACFRWLERRSISYER